MNSSRNTWIGGAAVVAILLAVAAWFLLIAPLRSDASLANQDAEAVEFSNDVLSNKVRQLRTDFANIEEYRELLREHESRIPPIVDYEVIVDEIERAVEKSKVDLLSVASDGNIVPVSPFTAIREVAPVLDPETGEPLENQPAAPAEPETVSGEPPTVTGALSTEIEGFYQIPLTLTVQGNYEEILEFSDSLQVDSQQALLAYSISASALRETGESASAPSSEEGDISYVVSVLAYVLENGDLSSNPGGEKPDMSQPLPGVGADNPFAPER